MKQDRQTDRSGSPRTLASTGEPPGPEQRSEPMLEPDLSPCRWLHPVPSWPASSQDARDQGSDVAAVGFTNRANSFPSVTAPGLVLSQANDESSPFYRVGPPSTWEARAAHFMQQVRNDVATPLAPDEFA